MNEAKKHYEIILIDTGPILGSIEATPVAAPTTRIEVEDAAASSTPARELHPVANAIVDREVAKAAERRAILG